MTSEPDGRPTWQVNAPIGEWPPPWPQLVEIVRAIPHTQWTLMVQIHAAHAGLPLTRPTSGVDMVLHVDSGATTFGGVRHDWSDGSFGARHSRSGCCFPGSGTRFREGRYGSGTRFRSRTCWMDLRRGTSSRIR